MHVVPTLEAVSLRRGGIPNVILAAGASSASILSEHGHQLDTIHLPVRSLDSDLDIPCAPKKPILVARRLDGYEGRQLHLQGKPVLPLQAVDFNGDQLQDIVVMTYDALYGWAQVKGLPAMHSCWSLRWGTANFCSLPF